MTINNLKPYLDKSSKKYKCPGCKKKRLVIYYAPSGKPIDEKLCGRCDRENSCQYHLPPREYYIMNPSALKDGLPSSSAFKIEAPKPFTYIDPHAYKKSRKGFDRNVYVQCLVRLFGDKKVSELIDTRQLGTTRAGAVLFPLIDIKGRICNVKLMKYDEDLHRLKEPGACQYIANKYIDKDANRRKCFYGEHLLEGNDLPVWIVESEKTADIMSIVDPTKIWLATGGSSGIRWREWCYVKVLSDKVVTLCPDLDMVKEWGVLAEDLRRKGLDVSLFDLSNGANEEQINQGWDLADFVLEELDLINHDAHDEEADMGMEVESMAERLYRKFVRDNPVLEDVTSRLGLDLLGTSDTWIEPHPYYDGNDPYWPEVRYIETKLDK